VPRDQLSGDGLSVIEALCKAGLTTSNGDARRTIKEGGAYVNNRRVTDNERQLTAADLASESMIVLSRGKKKYALLRFQ
jgi:tyrosyl-tRNA synthetase